MKTNPIHNSPDNQQKEPAMLPIRKLQDATITKLGENDKVATALENALKAGLCETILYDMEEKPIDDMLYIDKSANQLENVIYVNEAFLQYLWMISYSLLCLFQETYEKPSIAKTNGVFDPENPLVKTGVELLVLTQRLTNNWTGAEIAQKINAIFDACSAPEVAAYRRKADEIFLWAAGFGILHEIGHSENYHLDLDQAPDLEFEADNYAIATISDVLTSKEKYNCTLGAISLFATCALVLVDLGDKKPLHGGKTHPNIESRVENFIKKATVEGNQMDEKHYGLFAYAIFLVLHALVKRGKIKGFDLPTQLDTNRDFYEYMLKEYRTAVESN